MGYKTLECDTTRFQKNHDNTEKLGKSSYSTWVLPCQLKAYKFEKYGGGEPIVIRKYFMIFLVTASGSNLECF